MWFVAVQDRCLRHWFVCLFHWLVFLSKVKEMMCQDTMQVLVIEETVSGITSLSDVSLSCYFNMRVYLDHIWQRKCRKLNQKGNKLHL